MRELVRRIALVAISSIVVACATPPVEQDVRIAFARSTEQITVHAETRFAERGRNAAAAERLEASRAAAVAGTDPWAVRFARLEPEYETVTFERRGGALEQVTRIVRISEDDLQRVFADSGVTVSLQRGEGWRELALYGGTSGRASREQQRRFGEELDAASADVAHYLRGIHRLYRYLDQAPHRARDLFGSLLNERRDDLVVAEEEMALLDDVIAPMERIAHRIDAQDEEAETVGELADLVFNPFPARISIDVPSEVLQSEGFSGANDLVIEPVDILKSIATLEGRWVSPDPLALLLRDEKAKAGDVASQPRRSTAAVDPSDVKDALRAALALAPRYVVRWRE